MKCCKCFRGKRKRGNWIHAFELNPLKHIEMKNSHILLSVISLSILFQACKKDNNEVDNPPPVQNEEEVITTLQLTFIDQAAIAPVVTATFRDPDGDGGIGPDIFDDIVLQNGSVYSVTLVLLNETVSPADTISIEVLEEADEHLFCFSPLGCDLSILRTDSDGTYEIGLESAWTTGVAGNGTVKVELKHQPDVKDGTCEPGDTDVEVVFEVIIE